MSFVEIKGYMLSLISCYVFVFVFLVIACPLSLSSYNLLSLFLSSVDDITSELVFLLPRISDLFRCVIRGDSTSCTGFLVYSCKEYMV